jgi:hypothetical protein
MSLDHGAAEAHEVAAGPTMVPVKNFSPNFIVYEYDWRGQSRKLELSSKGRRQMNSVPLEIWLELERDTALVTDGYIARTDRPITNPNIIENPESVIDKLTEVEFQQRVASITNPFSLYELVSYLEPLKDKNGKLLAAQNAVRARVKELTGTIIMDDLS